MNNDLFAHLHVHSHYSALDGYGTPKQYADRAAKLGFEALGLTDHGNVDGTVEWQRTLRAAGLRSILGVEMYMTDRVQDRGKTSPRGHITFWAHNHEGWKTLLGLITRSQLEGFYYKPRIDPDMLTAADLDGLIAGTACTQSFFTRLRCGGELLNELNRRMRGRFYLEVMPHNMPEQIALNRTLADISSNTGIPLLATNDCHYVTKRQEPVQEVLLAIQQNRKWTDPQRWRFNYRGLYLRTADEMVAAFEEQGALTRPQYLRAMRNTLVVAAECGTFEIPRQEIRLPEVKTGEDVYEFIENTCMEKLRELGIKDPDYMDRFNAELHLIADKNFGAYFRIIADLINWSRSQGIAIGPGRGSVGGSLIAYLMGITAVDPLRWGLSFERFISTDRVDWPDIDIDVEKHQRHLVQEYLRTKYGQYAVAGVSTFGEIGGRAAVRDVGRVFDWEAVDVDTLAKAIPYNNTPDSGKISGADPAILADYQRRFPDHMRYVMGLEGQIRNVGQHAAAIIVTDHDLRTSDRCALRSIKNGDGVVINWAMDDAEYNGLIKIDLLGLSTLSVFSEAERLVKCGKQPDFSIWSIDPAANDPKVYELLGEGRTAGIFQLSAGASTRLCIDMKPNNFEEITAIMALVRPGPADSGMMDEYLVRRRTGSWPRMHPIYEEITAPTFGVLVYQEQVMRVISRVAGLPENTADKIRKIIGKKRDPEEFKPYWEMFRDGCLSTGTMSQTEANNFWEVLQKWAGYGFNRAHSVEYATLAYWGAWMKTYYPLQFFCAVLSYGEFDDKNENKSRQRILDEMEQMDLDIIPPKVGRSDPCRWTTDGHAVYTPFVEIKGVGEEMAKKCATATPDKSCPGGFFNVASFGGSATRGTKLEKVLNDIGAYDIDRRDWPPEYFTFCASRRVAIPGALPPSRNRRAHRPGADQNPVKCANAHNGDRLCRPAAVAISLQRRRFKLPLPGRCTACALGEEATRTVPPSIGLYNVMVIGEAPGFEEQRDGRGFVGRAGDVLWKELERYNLTRRGFHVTNACKCFPAISKTPTIEGIRACYRYLSQEIAGLEPVLILVLGNTAYSAVWGGERKPAGITRRNGQEEIDPRSGARLVYCVHPSSVLRRPVENRPLFEEGVKVFVDRFQGLKLPL